MRKKVLTVLLLGTFGAAMLTACGDKGVEVQDGITTNEEVDPAVEETTEKENVVTEAPIAPKTEDADVEVIQLDPEDAPAEESGEEKVPAEKTGKEQTQKEEQKEEKKEQKKEDKKAAADGETSKVKEVLPEEAANETSEAADDTDTSKVQEINPEEAANEDPGTLEDSLEQSQAE